jgi:hypothetical protein
MLQVKYRGRFVLAAIVRGLAFEESETGALAEVVANMHLLQQSGAAFVGSVMCANDSATNDFVTRSPASTTSCSIRVLRKTRQRE